MLIEKNIKAFIKYDTIVHSKKIGKEKKDMVKIEKEDMFKIAPLFLEWKETLIWSCLQGYMGSAWSDNLKHPKSAQIVVGDFCFFAGEPNTDLIKHIPENFHANAIIMVPQNEEWNSFIEHSYPDNYEKTFRYAIKKEPNIFDKEKLKSYVEELSKEFELRFIDEELYFKTMKADWSKDLCSQFPTYEGYRDRGIGVVALHEGELVSGASSYTVYQEGIEIEIDTKEEYQRKGLALACASKLILECLKLKRYPSWDAQNLKSVSLAQKLGYHFDKEYVTYVIHL